MGDVPQEFTPDGVAAAAAALGRSAEREFYGSGEPYRSMLSANPWLVPVDPPAELEWGTGRYYDTTVARKHPHWADVDLPEPSRDLATLRADLAEWGYCLIADGLSADQTERMRIRIAEQAAAERALGIGYVGPSFQIMYGLVNKGDDFVGCIEHDPASVQAGPLIEWLLDDTLGPGWYAYSFVSNAAYPGAYPQVLHQDQSAIAPFQTPEAPVLCNTLYVLQDVDDHNGGTLFIPGSHRLVADAGSGGPVGELPPAVNLEAEAGTIMVFDGRLLHGTGVNRSDRWRYIMTQSCVKPWLRQQEDFSILLRPEVLEKASPKLLQRLGMQATLNMSTVEGHGIHGNGRVGDERGNIAPFRAAMDAGTYRRVGPLSPADVGSLDASDFTVSELQAREGRSAKYLARLRGLPDDPQAHGSA